MRIVHPWLAELVAVPDDIDEVAREISLRGFEVASVESGPVPVIDFEVTANRPDCLSHLGIAREASTIWRAALRLPDMRMPEAVAADPVTVRIEDADLCPRYCAQIFEVEIGPSPRWLAERLEAAGVRPISNIVDVTNYVMLELGQPMHAFDLASLAERTIVVRRARSGEKLRTLDGVDRELAADMLVIADAARATAVGGVMGGADSEISSATRQIVLESAYFAPASVRRTSKRLGLKTEASVRFERGGDIDAPPTGIARAAALLQALGAGRPHGPLVDVYPAPRKPARITLRESRIGRVLGMEVPPQDVPQLLTPLGFDVQKAADGNGATAWSVGVPAFRVDVAREIDLIEEVGRHHGFDKLPVTFPALRAPQAAPDARIARDRGVRRILHAAGFSEATTFAFIERQAALPFCPPGTEPAAIANPLSEKFAVLRPSLLPGLLDACVHNRRRERKDVRLFETGSRFPDAGEGRAAAFVWTGGGTPAHWSAPIRPADFFDAKGLVDEIAAAAGADVEYMPVERPYLVPGRAAEAIIRDGASQQTLAVLGQLQPSVAEARGFPGTDAIIVAEIDLDRLGPLSTGENLRAESLPRFPSIVRDVSILVDEALPAAAVRGTIRSSAPDTLVSIAEFDRYQGKGVPEGRISLSLRLTFRASDRTLTDDEVQAATERIVDALQTAHAAERR